MKNLIALAALFALSAPAAQAAIFPDQIYTVVQCRDANFNLADAGTSVVVKTGGIAGITFADISEETFSGPIEIGSLVVHSVPQTHSMAPVVYTGEGFKLTIRTHAAPIHGNYFQARLVAEIKGATYDKALACEFPAHAL